MLYVQLYAVRYTVYAVQLYRPPVYCMLCGRTTVGLLRLHSSQGGLDGVNAFHCRSCYMYSGTGTYSTAVQVPVPQLYGFLTVYF